MNETKELAEFVAATRFEDPPPDVVEAVRIYILDNLASGLVGSVTPWADMVAELGRESAPQGPCSVFARAWTTSASYAVLVNGTMIGSFETDHAFVPGSCHPSAAVFPAVLAVAERDHLDGRSLLLSVALGYEVACRVGLAATRAVEDVAGFPGPGTNASFGGAAGAGKALGLDPEGLVNALGIAGSHVGGLMEFSKEGSMTKRIHVGRGGQMGLESALLAARGFTAPSTVLERDRGFLRVYSPSPRPELLLDGLGQRYILLGMMVKSYACHASFHPVIEGICRFRETTPYEVPSLERVGVVGTEMMLGRHGDKEPVSVLGAQYSLPFSMAVALCRDVTNPLAYSEETLWDPFVRRLAKAVELRVDSERFGRAGGPVAEVSVTIEGSENTFTVTDWKGAPSNPYTFEEMAGKFRRYASFIASVLPEGPRRMDLSPPRIDDIVLRVASLEEVGDVAELARLLRTG